MPAAPTIRAFTTGSMPAHQSGDIIVALSSNGAFSGDWTTVVSGGTAKAAYKLATSSSMSAGSIAANSAVVSITGASTINASGATPGFFGGGTVITTAGANFSIPTFPPLTTPAIQLSWCVGVAGGGNPWLAGSSTSNVTALINDGWSSILVSSDGTTAGTVQWGYYGPPNNPMVTIKVLAPNPPGFFAMF